MTTKSKLTLSVDAETVEQAKRLGINMSEITETVLRTFTQPKDRSRYEIQKGFEALFHAMMPLLKEYDTKMLVGTAGDAPQDIDSGDDLYLEGYGFLLEEERDEPTESLDEIKALRPFVSFLPPEVLLKNLIEALSSAKEMRQERIKSLELARRIVEAITKDMGSKPGKPPARRARGTRRGGRIG